ncbi:MAG: MgtC/SapB family protein [Alphaproteobacteria bacterium]
MDELELFKRLGVALAAGILIGLERGWHEREIAEGARVAGIRTFAIIGLLGGLWALIAELVGENVLGFAFVGFAVVMIVARTRVAPETKDYGVTTVVAALVTFALGAVAVRGQIAIAGAGGVVTALLLGVKPMLHQWVARIEEEELLAVLKLLVMTLVLLPVLPDKGYGPWRALNPYELWWMVVLIASIHFLGYLALKLAGSRRGIPLAGLAGGLVASTAVAVSFSRLGRQHPQSRRLFAAGIALASGVMFVRVLVIVAIVAPGLLQSLAWPMGAAAAAGLAGAAILTRAGGRRSKQAKGVMLRNPFEFGMALKFGLVLAGVMLLSRALNTWLGDPGIYLVALVSGVADVDAISLSLARLTSGLGAGGGLSGGGGLGADVAATGIVLAVLSNTIVKVGIAAYAGGRAMALPVGLALAGCVAAGAAGLAVTLLLSPPPPG